MGAPLVGRGSALAVLDSALDTLAHHPAPVLRVTGEPGIGKTRLLAELARRADDRGFLVLQGRVAEFEDDQPFALFIDALDDYLAATTSPSLSALDPAVLSLLTTVFPAVEALNVERGLAVLDERYRVHCAVRTLLDHVSSHTPLVLILDDVH